MVATIAENTQQAARAAKEASQVSQEARKSGEIIQAIEEIAGQQSAQATANIERTAVSLQHQTASLQNLVRRFIIHSYNGSNGSTSLYRTQITTPERNLLGN